MLLEITDNRHGFMQQVLMHKKPTWRKRVVVDRFAAQIARHAEKTEMIMMHQERQLEFV